MKDKKKKEYNVFQNSIYILKGIYQNEKRIIPITILSILTSAAGTFVIPILTKLVIDQVENKQKLMDLLIMTGFYIGIMLFINLINGFLESQKWWRMIAARMSFHFLLLKRVLKMDYEKLEKPSILDEYNKASRATNDNNHGVEGMMHSMDGVAALFTQIIFASLIISTLNPLLVLIMLVLVVVQYIPVEGIKRKIKKEVWDAESPLNRKIEYLNHFTRDFSFAKDIRLFQMSKWIHKKHLGVNRQIDELEYHARDIWLKYHNFIQLFYIIPETILYGWLLYSVLYRNLSIANFTLYIASVRNFSGAVGNFLWRYADLRECSWHVNDFRHFIETENIPSKTLSLENPSRSLKEYLKGERSCEFTFENVSFQYEGQKVFALKDLNLTLKAGEMLAIVGLNGAGKTTMIKLLCRLYEPTEGRILLNGIDIREFEKTEYFLILSPAFQDVELYAFALSENVSLKLAEKTALERAKTSLINAGLGEKLDVLKQGLDTPILKIASQEGIDLSGGEKQKLALARALYKDSPVMILDEPTAALDALAEYRLYKNFNRLIGKRTAIYISHRLSSTRFCNNVAMFQNGRMVEYGTHEKLMKQNGSYAELFRIQAQYYQKEKDGVMASEC